MLNSLDNDFPCIGKSHSVSSFENCMESRGVDRDLRGGSYLLPLTSCHKYKKNFI